MVESLDMSNIVSRLCMEGRLDEAFEAISLQGVPLSKDIIFNLLQGCLKRKDIEAGRRVRSLMLSAGFYPVTILGDHLIRLFALCGSLSEAQISCSVQLFNTTENYVAFKVKTTSPKKYCVRPNTGVVLPGATCDVTVTLQAQRDAPPDMQCKDKFLVQSVILPDDADHKEVPQDAFNKAPGKEVFETKMRVVYVSPPQPPSPVPESSEEGVSPRPSLTLDDGFDNGNDASDWKAKLAEARSQVARLTEERKAAFQMRQQLQEELASIAAKTGGKGSMSMQAKPPLGFSFLFVLVVGLLGILVGYFLRS